MSKQKRKNHKKENKKHQFNSMKILGIVVIFTLVALLLLSILLPRNKNETGVSQKGIQIPYSHDNVKSNEASVFYHQNILPIINNAQQDPIPQIREIMFQLDKLVEAKKVDIGAAPTYRENALVATHQAQDNKSELWITFSGPRLMDYFELFQPNAYRDQVILAICHETLHVLYDPIFVKGLYKTKSDIKTMDRNRLNGEVLIWGMTVQKIIRPMLKNGRYVGPEETEASHLLEEIKDNFNDPKWIQWVKNNRFVHS